MVYKHAISTIVPARVAGLQCENEQPQAAAAAAPVQAETMQQPAE